MSQSYIYFVKPVGMDGPIKIGYSAKPEGRLRSLSVWSPFPLEIIGTALGGSREETFLHNRFASQHSHREWFHSSPLLRHTIERILKGENVKAACAEIPKSGSIRNQKKRIVSPERQRFYDYGRRIRNGRVDNKSGFWREPPDVLEIMKNWRGDYGARGPIEPTPEQVARLEEYLANPKTHGIFEEWYVVRLAREKALVESQAGILQ